MSGKEQHSRCTYAGLYALTSLHWLVFYGTSFYNGELMAKLTAAVRRARKKPGGSNVGDYKRVKSSDFCGPAGGAPAGSYPVNTISRARSALQLAHNAPNPAGIRRCVYSKYPSLKPKKK